MQQVSETASSTVVTLYGEAFTKIPEDLYIPPEALRVFLEAFQGPLDLLLYLIKKQNLDILDIPIAKITRQYMEYVELMQEIQLELAAEYLVMAAMLAEIKSRLLLPRPASEEEEEGGDPRAELVRRLQEYERFKTAAETLSEQPRLGRDFFTADVDTPDFQEAPQIPDVALPDLLSALKDVMLRAKLNADHLIERETLSIRERMTLVLSTVSADHFVEFGKLFTPEEGKMGVVVTFIAILELVRQSLIEVIQSEAFAPIHVKARCVAVNDAPPEIDYTQLGTIEGANHE